MISAGSDDVQQQEPLAVCSKQIAASSSNREEEDVFKVFVITIYTQEIEWREVRETSDKSRA